jgi:hypothetical protein
MRPRQELNAGKRSNLLARAWRWGNFARPSVLNAIDMRDQGSSPTGGIGDIDGRDPGLFRRRQGPFGGSGSGGFVAGGEWEYQGAGKNAQQ